MQISRNELIEQSNLLGYKPENLEKVYRLLNTLEKINSISYLKKRLVLKGGTALNLFCYDDIPRLSIDIDLNYVGSLDKAIIQQDRVNINQAINEIMQQGQYQLRRTANKHAGGKTIWYFNSVLGQGGTIEIDMNYMYRIPLWPIEYASPRLKEYERVSIPMLNIHELAAGKLSALFDRNVSRDLYDANQLLGLPSIQVEKLKLAFVVYLAKTDIELNKLDPDFVQYNLNDMKNKLFPVLQQDTIPRKLKDIKTWADNLLSDLNNKLAIILPLKNNEKDFINQIRLSGQINPELITQDTQLIQKISLQPALQWQVQKNMLNK